MRDFYDEASKAVEKCGEQLLLRKWRGHPRIHLDVSPDPVFITKHAAYKSTKNGHNSLEDIFVSAGKLGREIPFVCLIDAKLRLIKETIRGSTGTFGLCDWKKGDLLKKSFTEAMAKRLKIMLGHTHPEGYGAVCSNIQRSQDGPFGGDFTEMWEMTKQNNLFSKFHLIMTPRNNQVGVFELKSGGLVIYHPLLVEAAGY